MKTKYFHISGSKIKMVNNMQMLLTRNRIDKKRFLRNLEIIFIGDHFKSYKIKGE